MDDNNNTPKKTEVEDFDENTKELMPEELSKFKTFKELREFVKKYDLEKRLSINVDDFSSVEEGVRIISARLNLPSLSGRSLQKLAAQLKKEQEVYRGNRQKLISFMQKLDDYYTSIPEKDATRIGNNASWDRYKQAKEYLERTEENYIVIVGDTSAGKSTFCNALVGGFLLPVSSIPCTNVITEIHYCDKGSERARLFNTKTNEWEEIKLAGVQKPADMLNQRISFEKDNYNRSPYDKAQIFWNSPLLQSGFVIVDSPGISDSHVEINESIQQQIEAYLPKAIALLFVIDSSKGGFSSQFAHLLSSLATRIDEETDVKLIFNKKCTLFVANKWDQVLNDIELLGFKTVTDARDHLLSEIKQFWQSDFDSSQLVKLQANAALRALQKKTADPEEFADFCEQLKPFMAAIFQLKLSIVSMATENLLRFIHKTVKIHLTATSMKQSTVIELRKRLIDTKRSVDPKILNLQTTAAQLTWKVIEELKEDMKKDQDKIFAPCVYKVMENKHKEITTVHSMFELALRTEIERYCTLWERKHKRFEEVKETITKQAQETLIPIIKELQTILHILDAIDPHEIFDPWLTFLKISGILVGGILGIPLSVVLVGLTLGLGAAAAAVSLVAWPVALSVMAIKDSIKKKKDWKAYNANQGEYLKSCGREAISSLWEKVDQQFVSETFVLGVDYREKEVLHGLLKNSQKERTLEFLTSLANMCRVHNFINQLKGGINSMFSTAWDLLDSVEDDLKIPPAKTTIQQYIGYSQSAERLLALLGILRLDFTPIGKDGRLSSEAIMKSAGKKLLAHGGFSHVYEGEHDGKKVAIKKTIDGNKSYVISLESDYNVLQSFCNECIALRQVDHPNLVKYHGWCIDVEEKQNEIVGAQLYLVMELCKSDLAHIVFGNSRLNEQQAIDIALSIARGMQYLHEQGFIHKDLKFDNVLVDANGIIKISDFGLSKKMTEVTGTTLAGTPPYMAPEVINRAYGQPADVYSFGLMLWELWYGRRIYSHIATLGKSLGTATALDDFIQFMMQGNRPDMPADDLPPWADLIQSCWQGAPVERPLFHEIVLKLEQYKKQQSATK